jgi:glycosyltransferase involved in cell wall biosynthesis
MPHKLSVLVPVFNEEANVADCLRSLNGVADEMVVVDSFSTDKTLEIARAMGAKVLQREYQYSTSQKNWALERLEHPWVLILDADERLTEPLREEIRRLMRMETLPQNGFWIRRETFFLGRRVRAWSGDTVLRLFRRDRGRYEDKLVHGEVVLPEPHGFLRHPMEHYTFRSYEQYMPKVHRYSAWAAMEAVRRGKKSSYGKILLHPMGHFLRSYLLMGGFLDGTAGLMVAWLSAYSAYLKYAQMWALEHGRGGND